MGVLRQARLDPRLTRGLVGVSLGRVCGVGGGSETEADQQEA
jgi:hypothetical protein